MATTLEVRDLGSDANGGYFNTARGGVDYSQQNAAVLALADVVTDGSATATSASGGYTAAMLGNGINIAGTIYEIIARASSNSITLGANAPAASGQTARVGGALATIGKAIGTGFHGVTIWGSGTQILADGTANTSGNKIAPSLYVGVINGYGTTRGDGGKWVWKPAVNGQSIFTSANSYGMEIRSVQIDADGKTGITAFPGIVDISFFECAALGCDMGFYLGASGMNVSFCTATNCTVGFQYGFIDNCRATGCGVGFKDCLASNCLATNCTGAGFQIVVQGNPQKLVNCIAANCTLNYDIQAGNNNPPRDYIYCLSVGATVKGFKLGKSGSTTLKKCVTFGDAANDGAARGDSMIALTANPFLDAATGDFRLTGAAQKTLYAAGFDIPSSWLKSLSSGIQTIRL